jgi:DNA-binding HxlR family transcriptional regulator
MIATNRNRKGNRDRGRTPSIAVALEIIFGCKWSLRVLDLVRRGVARPGAMERATPGLSAKVLNERLVRLVDFGVLQKTVFAEVPPRVEYQFTPLGERLVAILDQIRLLEEDLQPEPDRSMVDGRR